MKLYRELAEYYFSIENNHRNISDDIEFVREAAGNGKRILDLGCGTGEHLNMLAHTGLSCTGIDTSEEMLAIARKRFPHGIDFVRASMCSIDYYNEYDIVISLFGSFNYLIDNADVESVLWNMYRALVRGGIVVLEIWNASPIVQIRQKPLGHVSTTASGETVIERKRGFAIVSDTDRVVVEVDYQYYITDTSGTRTVSDRHRMRAFTLEEICRFIADNGFTVSHVFSNTMKVPYNELSNKMIVVFRKL